MNPAGIARASSSLYTIDLIRRFKDLVRSLAPSLSYEECVAGSS